MIFETRYRVGGHYIEGCVGDEPCPIPGADAFPSRGPDSVGMVVAKRNHAVTRKPVLDGEGRDFSIPQAKDAESIRCDPERMI